MPNYQFSCPDCGTFALQLSMRDATSVAVCPTCSRSAQRVYTGISLMTMGQSLRQRLDYGTQPQIKRKAELTGLPVHAHQHQQAARPWQAGH